MQCARGEATIGIVIANELPSSRRQDIGHLFPGSHRLSYPIA